MSENQIESQQTETEIEEDLEVAVGKEKTSFPILAIVVVISLVLAIVAASGVGISWFKNEQLQIQQSQLIVLLTNKVTALQQTQQVNKNVSASSQALLNKQQREISNQLEQITEKLGRNRHDWAVSEIRYTLRQANIRLQLFNDKATALVALQIADSQLAKLADPALYKIRGLVNKEITSLKAIKDIDLEGISLKLAALEAQVKNLEVSITGRSNASNAINLPVVSNAADLEAWRKHVDAVWKELKTLVTIRRTDKKILPLLSEQESQQLRQALGLKIEIARLALLQQNTRLFRSSVRTAKEWLERYFNAEQQAVISITTELDSLALLQLAPSYPDISGSLAKLEQTQASQNSRAEPPVIKKTKVTKNKKQKKLPVSKEKQAQ